MNALAPLLADETSLVRRLAAWMPQASSFERADAANALARAYLYCELKPETRAQAEVALTLALDDPEPRVRRSLAEALAGACRAPRALVLALANDVSMVARAVLAQSPLLSDADLVDCAATGDAQAQSAIARRAFLAAPVAAALAEIGERAAVMTLIGNCEAEIATPALWRIFERFPQDAELRARLLERSGLPAALRAAIAAATAAECAAQAFDPRRAEPIARNAREQAFIAIAAASEGEALAELAAWLRASGNLTVGLLVRALACGATALFAQCLADMADLPGRRVAGLLANPDGHGFAALYRRAGMPAHFLPAFRIAVAAAQQGVLGLDSRRLSVMLRAVEALHDPALAPVEAMLWRLAGEATRAEAREAALALAAEEDTQPAPLALEASAPPVLVLNVEPGNENHAPPVVLELAEPAESLAA